MLEPNYRGSAGYGEKFRSLNVRNLGIGDAWDVLSGIDRAGRRRAWSIAIASAAWAGARAATSPRFSRRRHSDRFKAISVGAGISNWMTYYVNTDIHPFTRQYLKATPWDDPKIYADTSPMTYIKQAKTPTLIQHGDRRSARAASECVPAVSGPARSERAGAACRSSRASGIGSTKPKANRAAMQQNLDWFTKYIWNQQAGSRQ